MISVLRVFTPLAAAVVMALPVASFGDAPREKAADLEWFETKVRPILVDHCYTCHSADTKPAGGLRVDDRNGLLSGGNSGAAVVPGDPAASLLLERVKHKNPKRRMPKEGAPLTDEQIAAVARWIRDGAPWPPVKAPASLGQPNESYESIKREHWAWKPLTNPGSPAVSDPSWARDELDRFVLAGLENAGLEPVADADRTTLLRRARFDLTGLPPAPDEIDPFLMDDSPDAFARLVDGLIASPQFGERWGQHWLDVARYADSTGPSRNIPYPHAWKYRDYVIDSVNADMPFDRFVTEQIAGDLLPASSSAERNRLLIATGFLALGVKDVNQRFKVRFLMDNVDDQIDAVSRSILGLTVSCARCHDHKFDPIPTTDYYALAGIFTSTDNCAGLRSKMGGAGLEYYDPSLLVRLAGETPAPPEEVVRALDARVAEAKKAWDAIRGTPEGLAKAPNGLPVQRPFRLEYERLHGELLALTDPAAHGLAVHGAREAKEIGDTEVRIRGQAEKLGPKVPRGFLTAFEVPESPGVNAAQSGRLELARWLTSARNPLTPRVIVNRAWYHLFGRGIVSTVDNFGTTGDQPSNPELLDHLTTRFIRDGWSVKRLVRAIVLSRAYQLSSNTTSKHLASDPANALVWRHSPRRLDSAELRDAMLVASGSLHPRTLSGRATHGLKMVEIRDNGPEARAILEKANASTERSIYLPQLRGITPQPLEAFDPVEQTLVTGQRQVTTVPAQALYLLNSPFVRRQALALAGRVLGRTGTDEDRVAALYRAVLGRAPSASELERSRAFLAEYEKAQADPGAAAGPQPPGASAAGPVTRPDPKRPPENPDEADQTAEPIVEHTVRARDARTEAWLALAQALYGTAQFRYVR
jgi:cytochrome c553